MEDKKNIAKADSVVEQFLVFSVSSTLIIMLLYLVNNTLHPTNGENPLISIFSYLMVYISGLIFAFLLKIFNKERTATAFCLVFMVFYFAIETGLCALVRNTYLAYILIPATLFQFIIEIVLNNTFKLHSIFINHWNGKTGKELESLLYHENMEALDLGESLKTYKTTLIIACVFYFVFVFFTKLNDVKMTFLILLNTIIFVFSIFYCFFIIGYYNREAFYANMGFDILVKNKQSFIKTVCIIFLISIAIGAVISKETPWIKLDFQDKNPLPQSYSSQYAYETKDYKEPDFDLNAFSEGITVYKESKFPEIAGLIIKIVFALFFVIVITYFLVSPFFTSGWKDFWKEKKLYKYLLRLLDEIKSFLSFIFSKTEEHYATVEAKTFKDSINNLIKTSKKSKEKKLELDRLTKQFVLLIDWGKKHNILYKKNLAPAEYTQLLLKNWDTGVSRPVPLPVVELRRIGDLFEKALYDKELLSKEEETEYMQSIRNVIKLGM